MGKKRYRKTKLERARQDEELESRRLNNEEKRLANAISREELKKLQNHNRWPWVLTNTRFFMLVGLVIGTILSLKVLPFMLENHELESRNNTLEAQIAFKEKELDFLNKEQTLSYQLHQIELTRDSLSLENENLVRETQLKSQRLDSLKRVLNYTYGLVKTSQKELLLVSAKSRTIADWRKQYSKRSKVSGTNWFDSIEADLLKMKLDSLMYEKKFDQIRIGALKNYIARNKGENQKDCIFVRDPNGKGKCVEINCSSCTRLRGEKCECVETILEAREAGNR